MKGLKTLMHKQDKVADILFDKSGYIKSVKKIYSEVLLPPGIRDINDPNEVRLGLQRWIIGRTIATNRRDIAPLREFYGTSTFMPETGVSLFDTYWFADDIYKDWEQENAYDNWDYKTDVMYIMISHPDRIRQYLNRDEPLNSPNFMVPGTAPRIWYCTKDPKTGQKRNVLLNKDSEMELAYYKNYLRKDKPETKGPIEKDIVSKRRYAILSHKVYCLTNVDTSKDIEMLSLEDIYNQYMIPGKRQIDNFRAACDGYHIPDWEEFIMHMYSLDDALERSDRELSDVGVLRDANTLEIIGFSKL